MREWLFVLAPLLVVGYFLPYPDQLGTFMDWFASLVH